MCDITGIPVCTHHVCTTPCVAAKAHHGGAQRADEEHQASLPGGPALLLPDHRQALLRPRLRQRRRGKAWSVLGTP